MHNLNITKIMRLMLTVLFILVQFFSVFLVCVEKCTFRNVFSYVTCSSCIHYTPKNSPRSRCSALIVRERASLRTVCKPRSCTSLTWCCRGLDWSQRWGKTAQMRPGCSIRWFGRWKESWPRMTWRRDNDQREMAASREQTQGPPQLIRERERKLLF